MELFSTTILSFVERLRVMYRQIIAADTDLEIRHGRLEIGDWRVPIELVAFEDERRLGYYDPVSNRIGINRSMMVTAEPEVLADVLRHEIAHQVTHFLFGHRAAAHGAEFRRICQRFGWGAEVYKASCDVSKQNLKVEHDPLGERVLARIKKLLKLASSDNQHEAEAATLKANQLLLSYNLREIDFGGAYDDTPVYLTVIYRAKRFSTKMNAISDIVRTFVVEPVINYGHQWVTLEVLGSKTNVEIADYVARFLDVEFEYLWRVARRRNPSLRGVRSKNSFMRGVARGYVAKIDSQRDRYQGKARAGLIKLEQQLQDQLEMVYPRLSVNRMTYRECRPAAQLGQAAGRSLSIHPAIQSKSSRRLLSN